MGNVKAEILFSIKFLKVPMPEGMSGPKFSENPLLYNVDYQDYGGEEGSYNWIWLPSIIDENSR